jgi:uncharacterized membrane protein YiaA
LKTYKPVLSSSNKKNKENADNLQLNENGYYFAVMILVAIGAILSKKVTRDNAEDDEISQSKNPE